MQIFWKVCKRKKKFRGDFSAAMLHFFEGFHWMCFPFCFPSLLAFFSPELSFSHVTMPPPYIHNTPCLFFFFFSLSRMLNISRAPCVVFISQREDGEVFARVSECWNFSVDIASQICFSPVLFAFRTRACMSGVSVADVTAQLSVAETLGPLSSHVTTAPFCLGVTCVACGPTAARGQSRCSPGCVTDALKTVVTGAFG